MIVDRIEKLGSYVDGEIWKKAIDFLQTLDPDIESGKYVIDGANLYAGIDVYNTKELDECLFEAHRKYIDIQVLLSGAEFIDWAPKCEMESKIAYCDDADCEFFDDPDYIGSRILLRPGMFALFFPEDGHMPQACVEEPSTVKKVVIKVLQDAVTATASAQASCSQNRKS
jgi:YhcH/YjgK/YiaL family protein